MPLRLNDVSTIHRFESEPGVAFSYRHAKSGEIIAAIRESTTPDGDTDMAVVDAAVLAGCVVGWEGIEDANGQAVPWPEDRALRRDLLDALPWDVVGRLRTQVFARAREAEASGKG